jgi:protein TonB
MKPPKGVYTPMPDIPRTVGGKTRVLVSIVVGGKLHDLRVTSARKPEFDEAALESVSQWRFHPATCDGEPMETEALVEVNFVVQ